MAMDEILFEVRDGAGWVTLNRPSAPNALTHDLARPLDARLEAWATADSTARGVLVGAGEPALCAGGRCRGDDGSADRQSGAAPAAVTEDPPGSAPCSRANCTVQR